MLGTSVLKEKRARGMHEQLLYFVGERSPAFNEKLSPLFYLIVPVHVFMHAHPCPHFLPLMHLLSLSLWAPLPSITGLFMNDLGDEATAPSY